MINTHKITARMQELHLSMTGAAALFGVSRSTLRRVLKGETQANTLLIQRMRVGLQLKPEETGDYFFATLLQNKQQNR